MLVTLACETLKVILKAVARKKLLLIQFAFGCDEKALHANEKMSWY